MAEPGIHQNGGRSIIGIHLTVRSTLDGGIGTSTLKTACVPHVDAFRRAGRLAPWQVRDTCAVAAMPAESRA